MDICNIFFLHEEIGKNSRATCIKLHDWVGTTFPRTNDTKNEQKTSKNWKWHLEGRWHLEGPVPVVPLLILYTNINFQSVKLQVLELP